MKSNRIKNWPAKERPRERLIAEGPERLTDADDEKPNVYCEVGYAKSKGVPFILTFHKRNPTDEPPWDRKSGTGNKVHFDLAAYRYISYNSTLNLRDKLKQELNALFESE